MKKLSILFLILLLFSYPASLYSQEVTFTEEHNKAIKSLAEQDTSSALKYFKDSIKKYNDAPSCYEYAKLLAVDKSHTRLTEAIEYSRRAVQQDIQNIPYRLLLAQIREDLFYASFLNIEERSAAKLEYEKILEMDSTCAEAHYNLGRLLQEDFLKFNRTQIKYQVNTSSTQLKRWIKERSPSIVPSLRASINQFFNTIGNFQTNQLDEDVGELFQKSEHHLLSAVKFKPAEEASYYIIAQLYIDYNLAEKALPLMIQLDSIKRMDKSVSMYLGLIYYLINGNEKAAHKYQNAMMLFGPEELEEFKFGTAKILLEPKLGQVLENLNPDEAEKLIIKFWEMNDPLYLTPFNERLLEHYSRIAYSNLFFSVPKRNITGWKTDRGETLLRYGLPLERIRYRSGPDEDRALKRNTWKSPVSEVWIYADKYFVFEDLFRNKNFTFNNPERGFSSSQFGINSHDEFINIKRIQFQDYSPVYEGPQFSVPFNTYQFKSQKYFHTDLYLTYNINTADSATLPEYFSEGYDMGLIVFDLRGKKTLNMNKSYPLINGYKLNNYCYSNSIAVTMIPDSVSMAFELMRKKDKGVFSDHFAYRVKEFKHNQLDISSILLASNIENGVNGNTIVRDKLAIVPKPDNIFSNKDPLFIYYEIYNLAMDENKLTDFEQEVTIRKIEEESGLGEILNKVSDVLGIGKEGEKITLTSHYKTLERNPQIYFQMDLGKYESGDYEMEINIIDKVTIKKTSCKARISWLNN